jgi:hypothetical protein
LARA